MDEAHKATDAAIARLERRIKSVYSEAQSDLQAKMDDFTERFRVKDEKHRQELAEGKITEDDYRGWLAGQVFQGKQWQAKIDQMTAALASANVEAQAIINGSVYGVFANNANWQAYKLEHDCGLNLSFGVYDEAAVARLLKDQPNLLPKKKVDIVADRKWSTTKISQQITQGIIQGEKLSQVATRLQNVTGMEHNFALTNARTAMTGAQNAGRQVRLDEAEGMGLKVKKEWIATLDMHTRISHRALDGQKVDTDKPFVFSGLKIRYPGDPRALPALVYNCRCTMAGDLEEFPDENAQRRDNINGQVIKDMSYKEWLKAKDTDRQTPDKRKDPVKPVVPSGSWVEKSPAIPPKAELYTNYGEYTAAVKEYIGRYGQEQYDQLQDAVDAHRSVWFFGFDEEKASRRDKAIRFDNTITILQEKYKLPNGRNLVIGDYENAKSYLTEVQRSRAAGDCAGQAWLNVESGDYVIGYNISYGKSFAEDLTTRSEKMKKDEMMLSVFENDSPEGIAIHEYGHQMADYLTNGMIHGSPNSEAYWAWYKTLSKDDIKAGISSYAATNRGEFEAECFAELQTDNPRPLAVKYGEFLKKAIEEDCKVDF